MSGQTPGGWSDFSCEISAEAKQAFDQAFDGFAGVSYSAVAVASQVVNGINYTFLTNATPVYPGAPSFGALVRIYQPVGQNAHLVQVQRID